MRKKTTLALILMMNLACAMAQARFIIRINARVVFFLIDFVF